ncbi:IclR family transcriptional regulator [Nocardia camponoti]|uniref:Transcriptional regulator n=1 Tax=Nocardia camponoti TaxID=1616106 RepID=A0A917Q9W4_9NOCA|nr:IclR family transcriptional regulator [Nocardia camponoti]GGK36942.1 transcriptional regulator [Nocardia camponoti]
MATTPSAGLERAALLIDAFDGPGRLTLADIVRRTGLPRSSAHRMLDQLVQLRWLRRDGRDYELGLRLVELGSLAVHQDRLHRAALPYLRELHRATGFVVHLAVLDGDDVVYLDKVGGEWNTAVPSRVGGRRPAHTTALGKALLAANDAHPRAIADELAKVHAHGYAVERGLAGIGCVAAAIGDPVAPIAAVSVCGPADRMHLDHRLAAPVRTTALNIWRHMNADRVHPTLQQSRPLPARAEPTYA